ncbi:MCE family protein [Rhodococcus chondri]|uniref:MCE family protein n=1 Tax=Rhodococcus chondri TaxID=3065941 RepID=A0ABU7JM75_9NOCA|nr:MCE family protein [Rhodococcus sp. CC-R104]MEE2030817.1 MCE family protein [Rhodococcus sp. CC-R104]
MNPSAKTWLLRGIATVLVLALCGAGLWYIAGPDRTRTVTAQFASVSGIYPGSHVAVLGLPVGTVEDVRPSGTVVEVTMTVPSEIDLPADVSAFVMNPSVISDRFIELGPAYRQGPKFEDGDVLPTERSHAPINWDEMLESVDTLAAALGPGNGNLGRTLELSADATAGLGDQMNDAIVSLSQATSVIGAKSGDIGALIDDLGVAVAAVNSRQGSLSDLVDGMGELGEEMQRQNLDVGGPIANLTTILDRLDTLLAERGGDLEAITANARTLTDTFAAHEVGFAELFDVLPLAMQNIDNAIGPNGRGRIRLNISTQINQFPRARELCERERLPLCTGAGFTNPITVPFDLADPFADLVPESLDRALGEGGPR